MRPLKKLGKKEVESIKLICFDCDGVTVKKGTEIEETETSLKIKTKTLSDEMLEKLLRLKKYFHINFSSGRSLLYLERMYGRVLWGNASLTGEIGIFTLINGRVIQHEYFSPKDLEIIKNIKLEIRDLEEKDQRIRGFEPKQFLITVHCREEIKDIYDILKKYDKEGRYYCWWSGEA
jgi:hydroxymethylpyrimidine pyrophosphatase-like HAD family hydrolase